MQDLSFLSSISQEESEAENFHARVRIWAVLAAVSLLEDPSDDDEPKHGGSRPGKAPKQGKRFSGSGRPTNGKLFQWTKLLVR